MFQISRENSITQVAFFILKKELTQLENLAKNHLHLNEKNSYDLYKFERRKLSYLLGKIACKKALKKIHPEICSKQIFIDKGVFEQPIVRMPIPSNLKTTISHCQSIGIALVFDENQPLGVDIEEIDQTRYKAYESCLHKNELYLLKNISDQTLYLTIFWTIKEALSKVLMTGLTYSLQNFEIDIISQISHTRFDSTFKNIIQYKASSFHFNNYVCSVIYPAKSSIDFSEFEKELNNTLNKNT